MNDQETINTLRDIADKLEKDLAKKRPQWRITSQMYAAAEILGLTPEIEGTAANACTRDYDLFKLLSKLEIAFNLCT